MGMALQLVMAKFYFLLYLSLTKLQKKKTFFFLLVLIKFIKQTAVHVESMRCLMMWASNL